jgi:hypothetical protein
MKKTITVAFLTVVISVTLAYGNSTNWFQSAKFTGNLMPDTTTRISPISLDIGNLESGSGFNVSGSGTITVGQTNGVNLSNVLMTPHLYIPDSQRNYWLERFIDLSVNFTLDNTTYTMPIIEDKKLMIGQEGSTILGWKDYLQESFDRSQDGSQYCYYQLWNVTHLDQGIHDFQFSLYGLSNLANQPLPMEVDFSQELTL